MPRQVVLKADKKELKLVDRWEHKKVGKTAAMRVSESADMTDIWKAAYSAVVKVYSMVGW